MVARVAETCTCRRFTTFIIHSFIHSVVILTTSPEPLPKRPLHIVRSGAFSFKWEIPLLSLRSSSSFLHHLPRLPVTYIPPFIFPSITCCRRQFLCKCDQSSVPLVYLFQVGYSSAPWLYVTLLHFLHDRSNWSFPSFSRTTFQTFPPL